MDANMTPLIHLEYIATVIKYNQSVKLSKMWKSVDLEIVKQIRV